MKKKTKKMIMKVVKRSARILICALLIMTQILPVYASISASDGMGVVTKLEFNSVMADFNSRVAKFEMGINSKIENEVNTYLSKMDLVGAKGYVINDETEITGTKNATTGIYTNVTAIVGVEIANLKVGDNIFVRDTSACNYYVSQVSPTISLSVLNKSINNVVDNLISTDIDKPLSANMGKKLNDEKQIDIMTNITGSANEVLARNSANNGLEFKTVTITYNAGVIGEIFAYGGDDTPVGCVLCNGAYVSRTGTYANLYNKIKTQYGYSSSTDFRLPLLNDGRYMKGSSTNGTYQTAQAPNITGQLESTIDPNVASGAFSKTSRNEWTINTSSTGSIQKNSKLNFNANNSSEVYKDGVTTIDPLNVSQKFYIRYAYEVRTATITLS